MVRRSVHGAIAGQATYNGLVQWCLHELTGPAFYMPMWLWAKFVGTGDAALRMPSLALSIGAPLLIAWRGHADRDLRLFWATLAMLWMPALATATEARPYSQLFFLCALQAMLFLRVTRSPSRGLVLGWASVTALAVLTHYYALAIGGLQALALIVSHRRTPWRLGPALFPLGLAAVWMLFHARFLLDFAAGHIASYAPVPLWSLAAVPWWVFGQGLQGFLILALLVYTRASWWLKGGKPSPEALLIGTGVASIALIVVAGLFRATLMPRYLTPGIPALLFGLAYWAKLQRPHDVRPVFALFGISVAAMAVTLVTGPNDIRFLERRSFQFETASAWLMERAPTRLVFLWPTATGAQSHSAQLAEVAGFFFARSRHPVTVEISRGGLDPNRTLLQAAGDDPRTAILWVSDNRSMHDPAPRIAQIDSRWECQNSSEGQILIVACRRRS